MWDCRISTGSEAVDLELKAALRLTEKCWGWLLLNSHSLGVEQLGYALPL